MTITSSKLADKYQGRSIEAMIAIATAHKNRSLKEFEKALNSYQDGKYIDIYYNYYKKLIY